MRRSRLDGSWLAVLVAVVAVALTACGGSSTSGAETVPPSAYVGEVCRAVVQWNEAVASAFRSADGRPDTNASSVIRSDMLDFFDDVQQATEALQEDIDDTGTPDVPDGVAIAEETREEVATAADRLRANRDAFADIPVTDVQPAASIEGAMTTLGEQFDSVTATVDRLAERSPELRRARAQEAACGELDRQS